MHSHETIDKACRAKRSSDKEKDMKWKEADVRIRSYKKRGRNDGDNTKGKYRDTSLRSRKPKSIANTAKKAVANIGIVILMSVS